MSRQIRHTSAHFRQGRSVLAQPHLLPADFPLRATPWVNATSDLDWVHFHDVLEVGICEAGHGQMLLGDRLLPFAAGGAVIVGSRVLHRARTPAGIESRWLYLHLDPLRLLGAVPESEVLATADLAVVLTADDPASALLRTLAEEARRGGAADRAVIRGLLLAALARVVHAAPTNPTAGEPDRLAPALALIAQHGDGILPIPALARACGLSDSGFRLAFTETLGLPPLAYLTRWRVHRAAERLRDRRQTVAAVALASGFGSISQFDRAFRSVMGLSPRRFRAGSTASATSAPSGGSPPPG